MNRTNYIMGDATVRTILLATLTILTSLSLTIAQTELCPPIVQTALAAVEDGCGDMQRNEVCYGNNSVSGEWTLDTEPLFSNPGDIASITGLQQLTVAELDEDTNKWGVAKMSLLANVPDSVPGQNIIFLILGDVEISDAENDMQAFYFSSGISRSVCKNVPENGIIINTPDGIGQVDFTINGVDVSIGSTAYLTAPEDGDFGIQLLEGDLEVTVDDVTESLEPNEITFIPLDETGNPEDSPSEPEPASDEIFDESALLESSPIVESLEFDDEELEMDEDDHDGDDMDENDAEFEEHEMDDDDHDESHDEDDHDTNDDSDDVELETEEHDIAPEVHDVEDIGDETEVEPAPERPAMSDDVNEQPHDHREEVEVEPESQESDRSDHDRDHDDRDDDDDGEDDED